mgnify:CR=1 FL=1
MKYLLLNTTISYDGPVNCTYTELRRLEVYRSTRRPLRLLFGRSVRQLLRDANWKRTMEGRLKHEVTGKVDRPRLHHLLWISMIRALENEVRKTSSSTYAEAMVRQYESQYTQAAIHTPAKWVDLGVNPLPLMKIDEKVLKPHLLYYSIEQGVTELHGYNLAYYKKVTKKCGVTNNAADDDDAYVVYIKKSGGRHRDGSIAALTDPSPLRHAFVDGQIVALNPKSRIHENYHENLNSALQKQEVGEDTFTIGDFPVIPLLTKSGKAVMRGMHTLPSGAFKIHASGYTTPPILDVDP